ncbi:MAG: 16S rRNA pseudouridine(516) synthase, partial [Clostridiales bacterium]|nr:16S rRNA pseudouridine(516) synthase [Clostridiales bacterium]
MVIMGGKIRLDKYLADMSFGTRTEVKQMIKKGLVTVNGAIVKKSEVKVGEEDQVSVSGKEVTYSAFEYFMLHKPAG